MNVLLARARIYIDGPTPAARYRARDPVRAVALILTRIESIVSDLYADDARRIPVTLLAPSPGWLWRGGLPTFECSSPGLQGNLRSSNSGG